MEKGKALVLLQLNDDSMTLQRNLLEYAKSGARGGAEQAVISVIYNRPTHSLTDMPHGPSSGRRRPRLQQLSPLDRAGRPAGRRRAVHLPDRPLERNRAAGGRAGPRKATGRTGGRARRGGAGTLRRTAAQFSPQ